MSDYFESSGATYPWYDNTTPNASYDATTQKTWVVWESWNGAARTVKVKVFNHVTAVWSLEYTVGVSTLHNDSHGVPSLIRDTLGYWHVLYGAHAAVSPHLQHATTTNPDDPSTWTEQASFNIALTYPHPFMIGADLWITVRFTIAPVKMPLVLYKATLSGAGVPTYSAQQLLADFGNDSRAYQSTSFLRSGVIHITLIQSDYNVTWLRNIYYLRLITATGAIENFDGSVSTAIGSLPITQPALDNSYRLIATNPTGSAAGPSLCFDDSGNPHILYGDGPLGGPITIYHTAYIAGAWTTPFSLGIFTGALSIIPALNNGVTAYMAKNVGFANGGDMWSASRPSGGPWGAPSLFRSAASYALVEPSLVQPTHPNARVIFTEQLQTDDDTTPGIGTLKGWMYGDAGYIGSSGLSAGGFGGGALMRRRRR